MQFLNINKKGISCKSSANIKKEVIPLSLAIQPLGFTTHSFVYLEGIQALFFWSIPWAVLLIYEFILTEKCIKVKCAHVFIVLQKLNLNCMKFNPFKNASYSSSRIQTWNTLQACEHACKRFFSVCRRICKTIWVSLWSLISTEAFQKTLVYQILNAS